jgi:hypothetical protein
MRMSRGCFSNENGDCAWVVYYRRAAFCCAFFRQKDSIQKIFIKKYFLFTMKVFVVQLDRETWQILRWWRRGWNMCRSGWDNSKKFLYCRFRRTVKAMGQVYECLWRICREIYVSSQNVTHFTFYIHLWPIYWPSIRSFPTLTSHK